MYKKVSLGLMVIFSMYLFQAKSVFADVLLNTYNDTSTPAIYSKFAQHSFLSGNYLYVSTNPGGVNVINTQGTPDSADDVLTASYNSTSTPAIASDFAMHSFLSGNLLYISAADGGLSVIDTQGTPTQSDDTLLTTYGGTFNTFSPRHAFINGNFLYVSVYNGGGFGLPAVTVIDMHGTVTPTDDTVAASYSADTSPAIAYNDAEHSFLSGNLLYISARLGLSVVNTQGTTTQADDTVVTYNTASTPAIADDWTHSSFLSGTLLYISTAAGLSVINTQGTFTQADDILVGNYNASSTPAITGSNVSSSFFSGNLLYINTLDGGITVVDTQGTQTITDDIVTTSYTQSSSPALTDVQASHSFLNNNLLYVSTRLTLTFTGGGLSVFQVSPIVSSSSASDTITVNLPINATISITSPADVTMGAITGTGQSTLTTNQAEWITKTNNAAGYELSIQASSADMTNANLDTVAGYTPATPGTPEPWNIATTDSEWGMHYSFPQSTLGNDTIWGTGDTYADNWVNVPTTPYVIETATAPTDNIGDSAVILFGAEVGSDKIQPTGTYSVDVTMTATTL